MLTRLVSCCAAADTAPRASIPTTIARRFTVVPPEVRTTPRTGRTAPAPALCSVRSCPAAPRRRAGRSAPGAPLPPPPHPAPSRAACFALARVGASAESVSWFSATSAATYIVPARSACAATWAAEAPDACTPERTAAAPLRAPKYWPAANPPTNKARAAAAAPTSQGVTCRRRPAAVPSGIASRPRRCSAATTRSSSSARAARSLGSASKARFSPGVKSSEPVMSSTFHRSELRAHRPPRPEEL